MGGTVNKATRNALSSLIVQVVLLAFSVYVAVSPDAFPGATTLARAGIVALSFGLILVALEVERLKAEVRALTVLAAGALGVQFPRDDRAAVDVLVRALSSDDPAVREKAHRNLLRLTGQDLPLDAEAWRSWWATARDGFTARKKP
jgi:hypothetical protein